MIVSKDFYELFVSKGIKFFAGVPDSLLKDFCAYVSDNAETLDHVIAANEGGAVSLAAGHYLATGNLAVVYLQNSGLGNCINPLLSLADAEVYSIPMVMLIGWRGEPGKKDEPQHKKQGKVTMSLLEAMGIPSIIIDKDSVNYKNEILQLIEISKKTSSPVAIVIREGTFEKYTLKKDVKTAYPFIREEAVALILNELQGKENIIVSTTGKTSREIFEYREAHHQHHGQDFLTVGSMGHASQIALAIAMAHPTKNIYCIDGDGAAIMHLGAFVINGSLSQANYFHIVLNNGAHDSVGGQPTAGFDIDFTKIAASTGYKTVLSVSTREEILSAIHKMISGSGPFFLEVKVNKGSRDNLGRPTTTTIENKTEFMGFLQQ